MVNGTEGGYTLYFGNRAVPAPDKEITPAAGTPAFIYDAAMAYAQDGVPLIVIGGEDYGMGSSRDWAAKGTNLLGVKAVITKSFERIHRSNLIGMGVLPLNFADKADYDRITPLKDATFSILGLNNGIAPRQQVTLRVQPADAEAFDVPVIVRIDTPIEKNTIWRAASCNMSLPKSSDNGICTGRSRYGFPSRTGPFHPKARPVRLIRTGYTCNFTARPD